MFPLSWNVAFVGTLQMAIALAAGSLAYTLSKKLKSVPLKVIIAGPFWIVAVIFATSAAFAILANMFSPIILWIAKIF